MKKRVAILFALVLALCLTACGGLRAPGDTVPSTGGEDDGRIGEVIHTYFYDFVVNDAVLADEYYGYTPAEGNRLLITNVTVQNTSKRSITMADAEFEVIWSGEEEIEAAFPITTDPETGEEVEEAYVNDEQLPYEFDLGINEQTWGYFVYEVPAGVEDFAMVTEDSFEGGETGDLYVVYFTAEDTAQD